MKSEARHRKGSSKNTAFYNRFGKVCVIVKMANLSHFSVIV